MHCLNLNKKALFIHHVKTIYEVSSKSLTPTFIKYSLQNVPKLKENF